jgi:hypothetical protein
MANADIPNGFKPFGRLLRAQMYTAGAAVYPGDAVALAADGKIDPSAGDALIGVALGYASADGVKVLVADHPDQLFEVQADGADIAAVTDYGGNFDIVNTSPSTAFLASRQELDSSTADAHTEVANPIKLIRIVDAPDNAFGEFAKCVVKINNHQLVTGAVSAPV